MALLNKLIVVVLAFGFVQPSSQRAVTPVTMFDVSLISYMDFQSGLAKTYDAISKGIDFRKLWKDLKKHPADYATSAFSPTFMGLYAGAKRFNPWSVAAGGAAGAATGIFGHYVVTHNFEEKGEEKARGPIF